MFIATNRCRFRPPSTHGPNPPKTLWSMMLLESGRIFDQPVHRASGVTMNREEPIVRVGSRDFLLINEGGRPKMLGILDP